MSPIIEATGFNNTLAPYGTCNNTNNDIGNLLGNAQTDWQAVYLQDALVRLQAEVDGLNLTIADLAAMQQLCSYEVGVFLRGCECACNVMLLV